MLIEFKGDYLQHDQVFIIEDTEAGASESYDLHHVGYRYPIRSMSAESAAVLADKIRSAEQREREALVQTLALGLARSQSLPVGLI